MPELISLVALAVVVAAVVYVVRRVDALQRDLAARAAGEASAAAAASAEARAQVATLQQALQAQLASVQQSVASQVGQTQSTLSDVRERLGALQQQSREISDLAKDVGSLQDLLKPPKLRGGLGELLLERLLEDILPGRYERQYEFPSRHTRVDAVVRIGDKLVPIDAKFPLEQFQEAAAAATPEERKAKRRAFFATVRKHVDAIAERYIVPQDGTIDFAFMYVPAETVYYEITVREEDDTIDLRRHCQERGVLPVSPNTLQAFLAAVLLGLSGMAIQQRAKEIQSSLSQILLDLARAEADQAKVAKHLDNARQAQDGAARWLSRAGERLRQASSTAIAESASQPALPLDVDDATRA